MTDVARTTGRGFLVITAAKAWFLVTGAVVSLGLPTLFELHAGQGTAAFGDYGVVINLVSIFNMVMITGTLQAVSKLVSEVPSQAGSVVRRALTVQLMVGAPIAIVFAAVSPLAARAFKDPALAPYIGLSAGVILSYSFYAIFVGYFNGTKQFTRQALLDIGFATIKTTLVLGAVVAGMGVMGAVGGFVVTAVIMTVIAAVWFRRRWQGSADSGELSSGSSDEEVRQQTRRILGYMLAIMAYTFFLNFIIRTDLFLLKRIAALRLEEVGLSAIQFREMSSSLSGVYTGMANVARLPYQAVIAITFVMFPIVSQATFEGDRQAARGYIRQTLRYSTIFIVGLAVVLIADRQALLKALYPDAYGSGHEALMWLSFGMVGFALLYVSTTILISAGKPLISLAIAAVTLLAAAVLNYAFLTTGPVGDPMLGRAGLATFLATAAGAVAALVAIYRLFQTGVPWMTVVRVIAIGTLIILLAPLSPLEHVIDNLPGGRLVALIAVGIELFLFILMFYGLMIVSREFGQEDRDRLKSVFKRQCKNV